MKEEKGVFWLILAAIAVVFITFSMVERARIMAIIAVFLLIAFVIAYKKEVSNGRRNDRKSNKRVGKNNRIAGSGNSVAVNRIR